MTRPTVTECTVTREGCRRAPAGPWSHPYAYRHAELLRETGTAMRGDLYALDREQRLAAMAGPFYGGTCAPTLADVWRAAAPWLGEAVCPPFVGPSPGPLPTSAMRTLCQLAQPIMDTLCVNPSPNA